MKNTEIKFKILSGILLFLVALFFLSFISPETDRSKNTVETALLNKKYHVSKISISSKNDGQVFLHNYDDFWGGEFYNGSEFIYFPVDSDKIKEFLSKSQSIIILDKIIDAKTKEQFEYYSLDENSVTVTYYDDHDNAVSTIHFGAMNQTLDKIFLWTERNMTIYAMDSRISYYLESSMKFWTDQNIIPQGISKNLNPADIQNMTYSYSDKKLKASENAVLKFPSLRFSEIISNFNYQDKTLSLEIIDGNGTVYDYDFYPAETQNGDCYVFNLKIIPSIIYTDKQKQFIKKMNYYSSISQWTYKSITELLPEK